MTEVVEGLDRPERDRIAALRKEGRFFWVDVSHGESTRKDLGEALGIPAAAFDALLGFGDERMFERKLFAAEGLVVFPFTAYLGSANETGRVSSRLHAVEVHLLVSRDFVLTLHRERLSLPARLTLYVPEGHGEEYTVYAVVEAMLVTAFNALNDIEVTLENLAVTSTTMRGGRVHMTTLRSISSRLSQIRRRVAPHRGLFEWIGLELRHADQGGSSGSGEYSERLGAQVNRLVDAIDAAADALATLADLRLNTTTYWLTVVATIFLPLTFFTGFFGMNFEWMTDRIDTQLAFWLLGLGLPVVGAALILWLITRGSPVQDDGGGTARRLRGRGARRGASSHRPT